MLFLGIRCAQVIETGEIYSGLGVRLTRANMQSGEIHSGLGVGESGL